MAVIHGRAFVQWLIDAGLAPRETRRVVIDASMDSLVVIHTEVLGGPELLKADPVQVLGANVRVHGQAAGAEAIDTDREG